MIRRKDVSRMTALVPAREPVDFVREQCYLKFWFKRRTGVVAARWL